MIKVKKFTGLRHHTDADADLENYLNICNITREQIISISYAVDEVHERILLVYEDK